MLKNSKYKKQEYWDNRYTNEESFEWFKSYQQLKQYIAPYICKDDSVLVLGCGNSPFSRHFYEDGFTNITNIDYSPVCIQQMTNTHRDCDKMTWITMDVRNLTFDPGQFDVVIEKGTLDAILVDETDPWHVSDEGYNFTEKMLDNVAKVLKPGGRFLSVTFSQPHFRKKLYCRSRYTWNVETFVLGDDAECIEYFLYVMVKNEVLSEQDKLFEQQNISKRTKYCDTHADHTCYIYEDDDNYLLNIDVF